MKLKVYVLILLIPLLICVPWDNSNDPNIMQEGIQLNFTSFKQSAITKNIPWSDTYWPSYLSGIANRWQKTIQQNFHYKLITLEELKKLSSKNMDLLSPAEKFDIYLSRYDYPTVQTEWQRTSSKDPKWEGLCHGWAPASLFYNQPSPVTLMNKDGLNITFGSSDIKALLTYWIAMYDDAIATSTYCGKRCNHDLKINPKFENKSECEDLNAGSFEVILANLIGFNSKGFVMDRDRGIQVWNQPVYLMNKTISQIKTNLGASKTILVQMMVSYAKETSPSWNPHPIYQVSEIYNYTVDLDSKGNVIGGDWLSWDRPDFVWNVKVTEFSGYFAEVKKIYLASINSTDQFLGEKSIPPLERSYHIQTFNSIEGNISMQEYTSPQIRKSWSINVPNCDYLEIIVKWYDADRLFDKIRIFEGNDGSGPLLSVLTGKRQSPTRIVVISSGAYISFYSGFQSYGGLGFDLTYKAYFIDDLL